MRNLIGFGIVAVALVTSQFLDFRISLALVGIGVVLFASMSSEGEFCDYIMSNGVEALVRKRYYINFLPFTVLAYIVTLGTKDFKIVWKEEYYKINLESKKDGAVKLSRNEYKKLRNEQRAFYSTQTLSKEFMESAYSVKGIGYKRKKTRLIVVIILALVTLMMLLAPDMFTIIMVLIYEAIFIPMIILWAPEYKDAKILHNAYERAVGTSK